MTKLLYGADGKPLKSAKSKRTPQGEPVIETTHAENIAARKFLGFMLDDIRYQLAMMAKDPKVSKRLFEDSKGSALLLSNYLVQQIKELDRVIAQGEHDDLVARGLKEHDEDSASINDPSPSSAIN